MYGLSVVPGKATVDVDGEGGGEVDGGNAEGGGEAFESQISDLARYSHLFLFLIPFGAL